MLYKYINKYTSDTHSYTHIHTPPTHTHVPQTHIYTPDSHTNKHTHTYTHVHRQHTHTYALTHTQINTHTQTHTHTHTDAHTHTYIGVQSLYACTPYMRSIMLLKIESSLTIQFHSRLYEFAATTIYGRNVL